MQYLPKLQVSGAQVYLFRIVKMRPIPTISSVNCALCSISPTKSSYHSKNDLFIHSGFWHDGLALTQVGYRVQVNENYTSPIIYHVDVPTRIIRHLIVVVTVSVNNRVKSCSMSLSLGTYNLIREYQFTASICLVFLFTFRSIVYSYQLHNART